MRIARNDGSALGVVTGRGAACIAAIGGTSTAEISFTGSGVVTGEFALVGVAMGSTGAAALGGGRT